MLHHISLAIFRKFLERYRLFVLSKHFLCLLLCPSRFYRFKLITNIEIPFMQLQWRHRSTKELLSILFPNCSSLKPIKKYLDGMRFTTDADVKQAVTANITSIVTTCGCLVCTICYHVPCIYRSKNKGFWHKSVTVFLVACQISSS